MDGPGIRRPLKSVLLAAVILFAGCLVTSCAQSARGAVTATSPSAGAPATPTAQPSATPTEASPTARTEHRQPDGRADHGLDRAEPHAEQLVHLNQRI